MIYRVIQNLLAFRKGMLVFVNGTHIRKLSDKEVVSINRETKLSHKNFVGEKNIWVVAMQNLKPHSTGWEKEFQDL